jgi:thiamine biosynthesis lipoprotein
MGTVFSIDVRDGGDWRAPIADVVDWLHHVDEVFSTYRADSDVSRLARGEATPAELDPDVAVVLDRCGEISRLSGGAFSATAGGRLDPSGFVKGWAVDRAAAMLAVAGVRNGAVNGGGDMQLLGEAAPGRPWRVGISDPRDRTRVLSVVTGRDLAVATSGTGEQGRHLLDPRTGQPVDEVASVSVVGPRVSEVDAYATAAFVLGRDGLDWVASLPGHEALVVHLDGTCRRTPGFPGTVPTRTIVVSPPNAR